MRLLTLSLSLLAVAVIQTNASAVLITNVTTATTVFSDDFEGVSPVSTVPAPDSSGDYDPVAQIGTWDVFEIYEEIIQVTSSNSSPDPGPSQGNQYLRHFRSAEFAGDDVFATLTAQSQAGQLISMKTMAQVSNDADYQRMKLRYMSGATGGTVSVYLFTDGAGNVQTYAPSYVIQDTGLDYIPGQWQEWEMNYVSGASTYSLSIDGVTATGLPVVNTANVGSFLVSNGGEASAGSNYFDAVPEPSSLLLLGCGLIGLLAYAWRKRK